MRGGAMQNCKALVGFLWNVANFAPLSLHIRLVDERKTNHAQ